MKSSDIKTSIVVVGMSILSITAGCGSGGSDNGETTSEARRIAASLESYQGGVSGDALEGLWYLYQEEEDTYTNESDPNDTIYWSEVGTRESIVRIEKTQNGTLSLQYCSGGSEDSFSKMATIDMEAKRITSVSIYREFDGNISLINNLELQFNHFREWENVEEGSFGSNRTNGWLFKLSDNLEIPAGEMVIDDTPSNVDCIYRGESEYAEHGIEGGEEWGNKSIFESFRVAGEVAVLLARETGTQCNSDECEYNYISIDDQASGDDVDFTLEELDPLTYEFQFSWETNMPESQGKLALF